MLLEIEMAEEAEAAAKKAAEEEEEKTFKLGDGDEGEVQLSGGTSQSTT